MWNREAPRNATTPTPGFYRVRFSKGGPWRAVEIVCNHNLWSVFIAGKPTAPEGNAEPWNVPTMHWVAFSPRITAAEHAALLADDRETRVDWHSDPPLY